MLALVLVLEVVLVIVLVIVLDWPWIPPHDMFDHEKLDVYRTAIEFNSWTASLLDGPLADCRLNAVSQLDRAASSVPLNIAEGNGKRSAKDRCKFLDIARGSALECAASLDVLVARKVLKPEAIHDGKALVVRIVGMLYKMTIRLLGEEPRSQE